MIGDGMGPNQVNMAHDSKGSNLNMENTPYQGTSATANASGGITDSAAGGTALACGVKTTNGYVGMNPAQQAIPNLREYFAGMGKKTGMITTVNVTDATPAAFGAHNINRYNPLAIAEDYINNEIDIIMGGGAANFSTAIRDIAVNEKGYSLISTKDQLLATSADKLLALFTPGDFPYYIDGYPSNIPTLEEMTTKCIEILNKNASGFFLMVEGGAIDHAGHANLIPENIGETLEFDKAVKVAMDFAASDGNTLVIITADHETGALQKNGTTYTFTSDYHSLVNVPVFATGAGASNFTGDMVNTEINAKIKQLLESSATLYKTPGASDVNPRDNTEDNPMILFVLLILGITAAISYAIVFRKAKN